MSVIAAKGFQASGLAAGIKENGKADVALVQNLGPKPSGAVVYTSNRSQANPILWSKRAFAASGGVVNAVFLNSGSANCFTGDFGYKTSALTGQKVAELLNIDVDTVQVCSTGLIGSGDQAFRDAVLKGVELTATELADSPAAGEAAANAILTTDTHAKTAVVSTDKFTIGGMAKGAGMLAPGLATMLVVLTTDAQVAGSDLQRALETACALTFNRLDSDGCMSTNDQVTLLASGASGFTPNYDEFLEALTQVCLNLVLQLLSDAEGARHEITIEVVNAASMSDAEEVGRSVARNNLFKAAVFGQDPNWGRVLAAIGTTRADFDPYQVDLHINGVRVCHQGGPDAPRELVDMQGRKVDVKIDLHCGSESATIWTNDLTYDYVHENSAYSS